MDGINANPFGILTFIVAPAILTNASSVMAMGISNRFARAVDRARLLSSELDKAESAFEADLGHRREQLTLAKRRVLLLVRALTAFYLSVGSFAAASLVSLFGAVFVVLQQDVLRHITLGLGVCAGMLGVGSLVGGTGIIVWETRIALRILTLETTHMLKQHHLDGEK